jgi:hypothetical protein
MLEFIFNLAVEALCESPLLCLDEWVYRRFYKKPLQNKRIGIS